jgi:hypothetical protein
MAKMKPNVENSKFRILEVEWRFSTEVFTTLKHFNGFNIEISVYFSAMIKIRLLKNITQMSDLKSTIHDNKMLSKKIIKYEILIIDETRIIFSINDGTGEQND